MKISHWTLLKMRNIVNKSCRENQNTHFMFNIFFFRKWCRLWNFVKKYGRFTEAADKNITWRMRFACWVNKANVRTHTHEHTHAPFHRPPPARPEMCNTYCFSTAKVFLWTRFDVTLYVHCLSCSILLTAVWPRSSQCGTCTDGSRHTPGCHRKLEALIHQKYPVAVFTRQAVGWNFTSPATNGATQVSINTVKHMESRTLKF
jgi:hypothetical protein